MTSLLTRDLGRYVADLGLEAVPEQGRAIAKTGFADCYAVMVAGAREPVVGLVDRVVVGAGSAAGASLIPSGEQRKVEDAALLNGVAAHVLDYDDVALDGHPSAVLVPAILAQAEASDASGAEMLAACRISPALPVGACCSPQHLQPSTPSRLPPHASHLSGRGGRAMESGDGCGLSRARVGPFAPDPSYRDIAPRRAAFEAILLEVA